MKAFLAFFTISIILIGCSSKDDSPTQEIPQDLIITSYSPESAMVGDIITFIGENIDPEISYTVSFNGIEGETTSVSETEIKAIVPQGATTGEINIKYNDKSLNVGELEITEEPRLIITSFSPDEVFSGDEVTFIGENIDLEITYTIWFNGIEGETTSVSETEIVAVVPQGATSGEIMILYEDITLIVGTIEIIEELDKLYGYFPVDGAGCEAFYIYSLDINTGALLEEQTLLNANSCYSYISSNFYRDANIFVYTYSERWAQGEPLYEKALIKNFNTGSEYRWSLSDGYDYAGSILAANDNKIYKSYRYYVDVDETYEIQVVNLATGTSQMIYEFPLDYMYDFKNSGFLPSTNELVFFTKDELDQPIFMKLNVGLSMLTSTNISDTYSSIFITKTERIFGVKSIGGDAHELVEIDSGSGNILSSLATISAEEVKNIDYSLSSNRIFALLEGVYTYRDQYLYKLNLSDGTSTTTQLDEQNEHRGFYGIYLTD